MGYIYMLHCEDSEAIKIGYSLNPAARIDALRGANAGRVTPLVIIRGDLGLETSFHRAFKDQCLHHEWFSANFELLIAALWFAWAEYGDVVSTALRDQIKHRDYYNALDSSEKLVESFRAMKRQLVDGLNNQARMPTTDGQISLLDDLGGRVQLVDLDAHESVT